MMTVQRYLMAIMALLLFTLIGSAVEKEQTLAGLQLGESKDAVVAKMGYPAGKIIALPPTEIRPDDAGAADGTSSAQAGQNQHNILVFYDILTDKEVWIGDSTIVLAGATASSRPTNNPTMMPGNNPMMMGNNPMMMPGAAAGMTGGSSNGEQRVYLPVWAYTVRTNALNLDQEQLIYRVNDTYSVAVTLTKKNGQFQVTDIVACSFEPLKRFPGKPGQKQTALNFSKKTPPVTSRGVTIGSTFGSVLSHHGWTQYCFAYPGESVSEIKAHSSQAVPVPFYKVTENSGSITVSPEPDVWENSTTTPGESPVRLTDGKKESIRAGFSRNCVLLYPDAGVIFTIADMTVVRIQIGTGVVAPSLPTATGNATGGQFQQGNQGDQSVDNPWF